MSLSCAGPPRALHIVYSQYASDPRTRRQAEALRDAGWDVAILCLAGPGQPRDIAFEGVRVLSVALPRYRGRSVFRYLGSYLRFLNHAATHVLRNPRSYHLIHVHSLPDFAVHVAHPARWAGAGVILDIHDLVPELFVERFGERRRFLLKLSKWAERVNAAAAHHVLTANEQFRVRLVGRGLRPDKVSVNLNLPDERVFWRDTSSRPPEHPVIAYHGTLVPRYGPDLVLEAAALLTTRFPDIEVRIIGDGDQKPELLERAGRSDLVGRVSFSPERVPTHLIPEALGEVTVGVVANRSEGFTRLVLPTKLLEYLALGIPAVVSRTETTDFYFEEGELTTVEHPEAKAIAEALEPLLGDSAVRANSVANARRFFERHVWAQEREDYIRLAERLGGVKSPVRTHSETPTVDNGKPVTAAVTETRVPLE